MLDNVVPRLNVRGAQGGYCSPGDWKRQSGLPRIWMNVWWWVLVRSPPPSSDSEGASVLSRAWLGGVLCVLRQTCACRGLQICVCLAGAHLWLEVGVAVEQW